MSNNPNDPDDPQNEDSFGSERLPDVQNSKAVRKAQKRNAESFTSFSEGMQGIDKFIILGAEKEQTGLKTQAAKSEQTAAPPAVVNKKEDEERKTALVSKSDSTSASKPTDSKLGIMRQARKDDSFTSFSEGLPTIDKFGILDPEADKIFPLMTDYLSASDCRFLVPYRETGDTTGGDSPKEKTAESKTLNRLMRLLDSVPWGDSVRIEVCEKPQFIEYSFDEDMIVLDKSYGDEQTVLNFAHQAYHSTNRLLTKLFADEKLDREGFIDLYMWSEVAALVTELNVRKELGITRVPPPKVLCQESNGSIYSVNVEELIKSRGMKTLHDVLFYSLVRGTEDLSLAYVFGELFDIYDKTFERQLPIAQQYIALCLSAGIDKDCI